MKYGFPNTFSCDKIRRGHCTITLCLQRENNDYLLKIAGNGIVIPEGAELNRSYAPVINQVRFIAGHQLRGSLEINAREKTSYMIRFPGPVGKERNIDE